MIYYYAPEVMRKVISVSLMVEITLGFVILFKLILEKRYLKQRMHVYFTLCEAFQFWVCAITMNVEYSFSRGHGLYAIGRTLATKVPCGFIIMLEIVFYIIMWHTEVMEKKARANVITSASINEAFNDLPDGICVARKNGLPMLTNDRFYEVFEDLSGSLFRNARELRPFIEKQEPLVLSDGSVWELRQKDMMIDGEPVTETCAYDITRLFVLSKEIESKNQTLEQQNTRLVQLLNNIASIQREEEILASRVRIHDELGQIILMTRKLNEAQQTETARKEDFEEIIQEWNRIITMLGENMADVEPEQDFGSSGLEALEHAAEAVGCRIHWKGDIPADKEKQMLLFQLVRETLMNAVHHGNASNVYVEISRFGEKSMVTISDDGEGTHGEVVERGGLKNMRLKIEQKGGILEVDANGPVIITVVLP